MKKLLLTLLLSATLMFGYSQTSKSNNDLAVDYYGYYDNGYVVNFSNLTQSSTLVIRIDWDGGSLTEQLSQYQVAFWLTCCVSFTQQY